MRCKVISILLFLIIGCKGERSNNFGVELASSISEKVKINNDLVVIIITETDCNTCFDRLRNVTKNYNIKNIKGLYYSKDPDNFFDLLNKINDQIEWFSLDNRALPNLIESEMKNAGPFIVRFQNDFAICEKF